MRGYDGEKFTREELIEAIGDYQKTIGQEQAMAVRVTPTAYVYQDYVEDGWEIGCINYPRFPKEHKQMHDFMLGLANNLLSRFQQNRMSVVSPTLTVLIESDNPEQGPKK